MAATLLSARSRQTQLKGDSCLLFGDPHFSAALGMCCELDGTQQATAHVHVHETCGALTEEGSSLQPGSQRVPRLAPLGGL